MTRHILRIPWAGPAVALALLFSTVDARPAEATSRRAVTTAPTAVDPLCITESYNLGRALKQWYDAWENYEWTLPGGTEAEILRAAEQLDAATFQVADAGIKMVLCLVKYLE